MTVTLRGKTVLVTGAGGFIGSHLAERLVDEGCHVRALIHYDSRPHRGGLELVDVAKVSQMDVRAGDIRDPFLVGRLVDGCTVVFHLAALIGIPYSYVAPASYVETNVLGTLNVLQMSLDHGVQRVIHTSTSEAYGTAQHTPICECHPLVAQSPYAATKIAADKLAESFHLSFGLPVATLRPFNTFGPRQSARAVLPTILSQLLAGRDRLRLGAISPVRDLNYVTNTVDAFVAMATSDNVVGKVLNAGSGVGVTIGELAQLAMKVVGRNVPVESTEERLRPTGSEVHALVCGHDALSRLTGWAPAVDLETGVRRTAEFIARHPELYRPDAYAL